MQTHDKTRGVGRRGLLGASLALPALAATAATSVSARASAQAARTAPVTPPDRRRLGTLTAREALRSAPHPLCARKRGPRPSSRPIGSGARSEAVAGALVGRDQAQATARPKASWSPSPGAPPPYPSPG